MCCFAQAQDSPVLVGRVTQVTDGDTIRVELSFGPIKVRLDGIDAPESKMAGGPESKAALTRLVQGKEVQLSVVTQDRYERLVAVVYLGELNVNEEMVRSGHAWAYRRYIRKETRNLCDLEREARAANRGLWMRRPLIYPSDWRKASRSKSSASSAMVAFLEACPR